jgi:hypothetical protein
MLGKTSSGGGRIATTKALKRDLEDRHRQGAADRAGKP